MDWSGVHFPVFTVGVFLFIPAAVFLIKLYRSHLGLLLANLFLLACCFYGFIASHLPGNEDLAFFASYRWGFAALLIAFQVFGHQKAKIRFQYFAEQTRLALPLLVMILAYPLMPLIIHSAGVPDRDSALQAMDQFIFFGHDPQAFMQALATPFLSEVMAFDYSFYAFCVLILFSFLFLKNDDTAFEEFIFMASLSLAVGYIFYTLVPAMGPAFTQNFGDNPGLHYMKDIKEGLMDRTRIAQDCFPSLHTAVSFVCLSCAYKSLRQVFWIFLPFVICIPVACVYLHYHYVIDIIAGLLLAFGVRALNERTLKRS